jgi:hypothetical protein
MVSLFENSCSSIVDLLLFISSTRHSSLNVSVHIMIFFSIMLMLCNYQLVLEH